MTQASHQDVITEAVRSNCSHKKSEKQNDNIHEQAEGKLGIIQQNLNVAPALFRN